MSEETNRRVGDYEILNELGSGGMGRVYRVRNVISERIEAMKILLPDLAGRQELAARFLREIKVLASLNHPNIAQLRTALTIDNQLVMIMEYVEGTSLAARLEHGPIVMADALNYISQVLDALSYAHQQRVIHRDIKPANMMLTPQGVVKLMDFGIARSDDSAGLTMSGTTLGSLSYMSPEQVKGQATDARSDLYSVGISLYEMVTGQRPFNADSDYAIMAAHVKEEPRPPIELQPGLPGTLNEIILMAIAKDPAQRFQTAEALRNALSKVQPVTSPVMPASTTRKATIVDSGLSAALFHEAPTVTTASPAPTASRSQAASDHARTVIDTRPPSSPSIPTPRTKVPSTPNMPVPPPAQSSHKGLYMALGALIVVGALAAVGIYSRKAEAGGDVQHTKQTPPPPGRVQATVPNPPSTPPPPKPDAGTPVVTKAVAVAHLGAGKKAAGQTETAAPEPTQKPADLDELEHDIDQLSARAGAINSTLDRMQAEQARAGYGLRGDMAQRQSSMKINLSKAQDAIERGDATRAKRYKDLTEADVDALEKFLGR